MSLTIHQSGAQPGATLTLRAHLTDARAPFEGRAIVTAAFLGPAGRPADVGLIELEPGVFQLAITASIPGVYRFRVRASGWTSHGLRFRREHVATGSVLR